MTTRPCAADVVIVGAGTAGSVLAHRLSAHANTQVLLLEAGDEPQDPRIAQPGQWAMLQNSAIDWAFRTTSQSGLGDRVEECPRGRVIGGSSAINAMGHMRGHPRDFAAWVDSGAAGWDYNDLLPYFRRSETSPFADDALYGGDGPIHLEQPATPHPLSVAHVAAGAALGQPRLRDHNCGTMTGATFNTMTILNGRRQSTADAYLTEQVRQRPNLSIRRNVIVDRLVFDSTGRATGLRLADGEVITAHGAVILAAGAIGSPSILMRSGFGDGRVLRRLGLDVRADMAGIGQNLQDHLLSGGNVYRARQQVPLTSTQHSEAMMYLRAEGQSMDDAPDLVVGVTSVPLVSAGLRDRVPPMALGDAYTLMFGITHPRSRGSMALASADPSAAPVIDPAYLSHPTDRAHFVEALHWARRLGASESYADWRGEELLPAASDLATPDALERFIGLAALTHHHPIGTLRMGDDATAPTATTLEFKGAERVFIADGSVMPSLTTGPVNAAIVAIAEKGSELIAARLHLG
ncbi:GMC family oxidoreductase [Oceanibium sediminis]|uniref:GMC family oxidoreductase n=1 Tax=Oceanibium sediminis TaxID=2026339 RepID=UPI000DD4849B|nr:GMC family oxidoreductase N-terminal domain-containing protein [Oceanibium sediminis]